ncbi:MAG: hypothetical protein EU532_04305 [Promethearchaeota archaeon]|nr:MAG: hypothetical protein EU532_04305 [Candidatus Lokiarchaeota archaeon]
MNLKIKYARFKLLLSDLKPILLSDHPNCENFDDHVYHIGKYKLCIGCFTFYPVILLTIIFSLLFIDFTFYNLAFMFFISFAFFSPIILNILGLTKYKFLKVFSKISTGIGVGLYLVSIIFFPVFFIFKILAIIPIGGFIFIISYIRMTHILKECEQCEYKGDWDSCPAMKPITDKLYEHGFKK